MATTIDDQWRELESESVQTGWRFRLAHPRKGYPLHVAIDGATRRRTLLLEVPATAIPPQRRWPASQSLLLFTETINGRPHCGVSLKEPRFADVFSALAEDLARRVATTSTADEAVTILIGQIARWQKFLTASSAGLSDEAQRGLWGELHCLHERLIPALGEVPATSGWKGSDGAQQDFQFTTGALEVKTTLAKQPQTIRISSERQLDAGQWPILFLYVLILEVRDAIPSTLPALVNLLRLRLATDHVARELFEDALLAAGYLDSQAVMYLGRGYVVRAEHWFHVRDAFPRIVETELPVGIGDVQYALSLAACERYSFDGTRALTQLAREQV